METFTEGYHDVVEFRARHVFLVVIPVVVFAVGFGVFRLLRPLSEAFIAGGAGAAYAVLAVWARRDRYPWLLRVDDNGIDVRRSLDDTLHLPWHAIDSAVVRRGRLVVRVRLDLNPWDRMLAGKAQPDGTIQVATAVWGLRPRFTAAVLARPPGNMPAPAGGTQN